MNNIQENIGYLKHIVEQREKYIHFSSLGTALAGILFCIFPFFYKQLAVSFHIQREVMFGICAFGTFIMVTVLSLLEAKIEGRELFPKSIRYLLGNVLFIGYTFMLAYIIVPRGMFELLLFLSILGYGGLILVSRMFLPRPVVWYGISLVIYTALLFFLLQSISENMRYIVLIFIPFGLGHLFVALGLFLQKRNTNNKYHEKN